MYKSRTFKKIYSFTSPLLIFLVTFLSLGSVLVFPRATFASTITNCGVSLGDGTYELGMDLSQSGDCLTITGPNVIINGNGYTLTGNINASGAAGSGVAGWSVQISNITINGDIITSGADSTSGTGGNAGDVTISNTIVNGNITAKGGNGADGSAGGNTGGSGGNGATVTVSNNSRVNGNVDVYGGNGGIGGQGTDGAPGTDSNGTNGADGAPGMDCDPNVNCSGGDGSPGENGGDGGVGGTGGTGGTGGAGGNGGYGGIINIDSTSIVQNRDVAGGFGGAGGTGGIGGPGGAANGGLGGAGGRGGYHGCDTTTDPQNPQCGVDGQPGASGLNGNNGTPGSQGATGDAGATGSNGLSGTINEVSDTTPPSVSITSPTEGQTISGTFSLTASASDNGVLSGVQFQISTDNSNFSNLGSVLTGSPFELSFDTTSEPNGTYYIRAVATDYANNSTDTAGTLVYISNAIYGCTDPAANNYNPSATASDSSCNYDTVGCMDSGACNYNPSANVSGSCDYSCQQNTTVYGCTDISATNYNSSATSDDGSCTYSSSGTPGCTDPSANNYNPSATSDDGSCMYTTTGTYGCTDSTANNYNPSATISDGSCTYTVYGCTDPSANNYNSSANTSDGSCTYTIYGCTDSTANNYNPSANVSDNSCTYSSPGTPGCTDSTATNYNSGATVDDGSCTYPPTGTPGCTDPSANNYNPSATSDDGSCTYTIYGCTDPNANNYNPSATNNDGTCTYNPPDVPGCRDANAINYNSSATSDDGSCYYVQINNPTEGQTITSGWSGASVNWGIAAYGGFSCTYSYDNGVTTYTAGCGNGGADFVQPPIGTSNLTIWANSYTASVNFTFSPVYGCVDSSASNYNPGATVDDGSCVYAGCTDSSACNYSPSATTDNGSCDYSCYAVYGCTDPTANNYNASANTDDGSCTYNPPDVPGCTDSSACNYNSSATTNDGSCDYSCHTTVFGCTDPSAVNYNSSANADDGSCTYNPPDVYGCTSPSANNYNPSATIDDGSCDYNVSGCTDFSATNYNPSATVDDGSCTYVVAGCTDSQALNFNSNANSDDGSCRFVNINWPTSGVDATSWAPSVNWGNYGATVCMYSFDNQNWTNADCGSSGSDIPPPPTTGTETFSIRSGGPKFSEEFPASASQSVSFSYHIAGCTNPSAVNYNPSATVDDGSCIVYGCTNPSSTNYNPSATSDDGSCIAIVAGCTDPSATNYNSSANYDDGSCTYGVSGCMDTNAINYNQTATIDDGSCYYIQIISPTNGQAVGNWGGATVNWGVYNPTACEFSYDDSIWNPASCSDTGQTIDAPNTSGDVNLYIRSSSPNLNGGASNVASVHFTYSPDVYGCTDLSANNYNSNAVFDDGSCTYDVPGCTDNRYVEYNPSANVDNGSCRTLIDNGTGGSTTYPQISAISATSGNTSATISWTTDTDSSSKVSYGPSDYTKATTESDTVSRVTSHSVILSNLLSCSIYHYKVISTDSLSHTSESSDNTFVTTGCTGGSTVISTVSNPVSVSSGGTVSVSDMSIDVPENFTTATSSATFQIKEIDKTTFISQVGSPDSRTAIGTVYNLKALVDDSNIISTFDSPIRVTLSYQLSDLVNIVPSSLVIYRYDGSAWYPLSNCSINAAAKTVSCDTNNFSDFAIFGTQFTPIISGGGGGGSVFNFINSVQTKNNNTVTTSTDATTTPKTATSNSKKSNFLFTKVLKLGDSNNEVRLLQRYLNAMGYVVAKTGPGSKGKETMRFGPATKAALAKYQKHYNIKPPAGYFGPITRSFVNAQLVKANAKK